MVVYVSNLSTQEASVGGFRVLNKLRLYRKTLSQRAKYYRNENKTNPFRLSQILGLTMVPVQ